MRSLLVVLLLLLVPTAAAHGDLAIHELETLAIRDFEGQEDSFPWEGFEIWDVYVGEGYNETFASDGVYLKANFAGDGTKRPTGGAVWTISFSFMVGEESFARELAHDGAAITSDFESLQWQLADGNVLQVKGWVPVANWSGRSVTDVTIVSSVDGEPRDSAPGGVHDPATGGEVPVEAPSTVVFPPMGEGRIVEEIPLTGPAKYFDLAIEPKGNGTFTLSVTNALAEQGQHVMLDAEPAPGWTFTTAATPHSMEGGASHAYDVQIAPSGEPGATLEPYTFALLSDIGGRRVLHAYLAPEGVVLTEDPAQATAAAIEDAARDVPLPPWMALVAAAGALVALRRRA